MLERPENDPRRLSWRLDEGIGDTLVLARAPFGGIAHDRFSYKNISNRYQGIRCASRSTGASSLRRSQDQGGNDRDRAANSPSAGAHEETEGLPMKKGLADGS